ncbi:condensin complex component cnd1 [Mucor ambiguus]|uniref:Condensin complex subunit 1 n=1 Tax=Mucor ambiguus TaxID=91626 RepID=A0A0C9MPJ9_9FUNG|nr:condensin complex component cnd1 [Mucor ambiguus]
MNMKSQFVLSDQVLNIQQSDLNDYVIPNETQIRGKSDQDLARYLNEITDSIQVSSENISDPLVFDKIRSFLKCFTAPPPRILSRLFDILLSAFRVEIKTTADDLENNEKESFNNHRLHLELYGFLVHWFLLLAEEHSTSSTMVRKAKSSSTGGHNLKTFDWSTQKLKAFDLASWLLDLKLSKLWTLPPDRLTFVTLFTKPAYQLLENPAHAKSSPIKERIFRVISLCVKHYDHLPAAQTTIMQNLQYWEHSAEPMAELLVYMVDKQNYTQLADEILREISNREFKDTTSKEVKDSPNPKTFATFLQTLAELSKKTILKNLTVLVNLLASDSYIMRVALIDILGILIAELFRTIDDTPDNNNLEQINGFFDLLEERMLDTVAYCRQKVLQVYIRLFELRNKFPSRRQTITKLCVRHLQDKSSTVRKYTIRALTALITTHPFSMYGGELDLDEWQAKLGKIKEELESVASEDDVRDVLTAQAMEAEEQKEATEAKKDENVNEPSDSVDGDIVMEDVDAILNENKEDDKENQPRVPLEEEEPSTRAATAKPNQPQQQQQQPAEKMAAPKTIVSNEKIQQLEMMRKYHTDAVAFIKLIHQAIPTIIQLLSSKSKAEVLESMDFLVVGYNYKIRPAADGVKKMLHLIWTKDTSDEGKGIKMKLIQCYSNLYLERDAKLSKQANVNRIAKNLIQLTYDTTLAELTSLEQLLGLLMAENKIAVDVIQKLWSVYGFTQGRIQKSQRRGAIVILGMLAKAKTKVVSDKLDVMLKIGLGPLGKEDLELARYTCIALQRLEGTRSKEKSRGVHEGVRFPNSHPMFARLRDVIEISTDSQLWFSLAEQAINTIFLLCKHPESLCEEILREKTAKVFGVREASLNPCLSPLNDSSNPVESSFMEYDMTQQALPFPQHPIYQKPMELAQLFFLVGHVALKEIVHLEIVEAAWKRKKSEKEKDKQQEEGHTAVDDELDQVGGTAEDDIGDAMSRIREREILFGPNSLLGVFGPILTEVCARNKIYTDRTLQVNATLALTKFMCVSSDFCEKKLQLLFTILEKSKDASIRSNIVIALGDMAVCFNTLIDDNITFLYNRLSDPDTIVRKNAVMVLTHLILNGMVKVKGQISEMAKCLEDQDQRISDLAKLFFTELASKDNAIYNNLPDIISSLTNSQPNRLEEESFRKIMKFIFSFDFTEKEKQAENIVDKLCQRFLTAEDERSWRDIAYCMSLLPFKSEKPFRKLLEGWPTYQDKIHEDSVHKSFLEIIQKGRIHHKNQRPELRALVDDFEQRIAKQRGPEPEKTEKSPKRVGRTVKSKAKSQEASTAVADTKKPLRKRQRVVKEMETSEDEDMDEPSDIGSEPEEDDEEDEDEEDYEEEDEEIDIVSRKNKSKRVTKNEEDDEETVLRQKSSRSTRSRRIIQEDDEDEEDEEDEEEEELQVEDTQANVGGEDKRDGDAMDEDE